MKPYLAQIKSNLRLMGRDRSVLFFSYLFPLVFFFIFAQAFHGAESPGAMTRVITAVLIIGILGNGFFGAGMRAVQDRETNVLRRFKVAPVGAGPIIVASLVSGLVSFLPVVLLFFICANVAYHMPYPHNLLSILLFTCIALIAFRAMGMIIAAVVNSAQEAALVTQLLYLPMLFLSGATFPVEMMPVWVQSIAQFLPATYLYQGMQAIMLGGENFLANYLPVIALVITLAVALFVGIKLFRWEKEEKIANSAKLWILGVLAPFFLMGLYQAKTRQNVEKIRILSRDADRQRSILFQNARIFVGDGTVIERGAVLIRGGKIAAIYQQPPADTTSLHAEVVESSGKTLLPGLIDMHVHVGAPGGVYKNTAKYGDPNEAKRRLAAYLYCGVTAVRSTGDWLDSSLALRKEIKSDSFEGAELFAYGPLFTAPGGHPEELLKSMPAPAQNEARKQFIREPKTAEEAREQVDELKRAGVDGIKAVLESGNSVWGLFNRFDTHLYDAVIAEAIKDGLPSATHTGSSADMKDAIEAGTNSIEHGSVTDAISPELFAAMKAKQIAYDPTLSVYEAQMDLQMNNPAPLSSSLLQQVGPADLLEATRAAVESRKAKADQASMTPIFERLERNLANAYRSGVTLITGSDAGNMLVVHGPTVQHEMELWVKAGIPPKAALQAGTLNAARVLRSADRIGSIEKGKDATLILVEGDPTTDISATEHVTSVYFRGEHIDRSDLFTQDK